MTMPVTKHNFLVTDDADAPKVIKQAFHVASTGRPGAVLVDVAEDAQMGVTEFAWRQALDPPGSRPGPRRHNNQSRDAASLVIRGGASQEVTELIDVSGAPFATTLMGRGALPDSPPSHLGMPGMHGSVSAVSALQRSDVLVAIGARFDDRVTGVLESFAPNAK